MPDFDISNMDFSFDASTIIAGLLFGTIGWYLFWRAKKSNQLVNILVGIALMVYPYFVSGRIKTWGIGILLCAIGYYYWED